MINAAAILLIVLLQGMAPLPAFAQAAELMLEEGRALEKAFREEEALQQYLAVVRLEPDNVMALCKASELYSLLGKRQSAKQTQQQFYQSGLSFAQKALAVNPNSAEANFVMAVSKGRIALQASGEQKIKAVKEIKSYADRCVQLDPLNYKGYHVLGKWYYEVSDLNAMERLLVKITYGGLPQATLEESIRYYEKSRQLNPGFLLNYLELAKAYKRQKNPARARALLQQMMKLPAQVSDDHTIKELGSKLLKEL